MYYVLFYELAEDYLEKRAPLRPVHLALAEKAREAGDLVIAGALANPPDGALLVFRGEGPEVAEAFAKNDPYVHNGLVRRWYVREWTVVVGG